MVWNSSHPTPASLFHRRGCDYSHMLLMLLWGLLLLLLVLLSLLSSAKTPQYSLPRLRVFLLPLFQ